MAAGVESKGVQGRQGRHRRQGRRERRERRERRGREDSNGLLNAIGSVQIKAG